MRSVNLVSVVAAALALPSPAAGQQQVQSEPQEVVVQGRRVSDDQVRDFVKALTDVPYYEQLSRFHNPVCPIAMGLTEAQNAAVEARLRVVARAAKASVAPANCAPNLFVIVSLDKASTITELKRRYPPYFAGLSAREIKQITSSTAPSVAWQVLGRLSADGQKLEKHIEGYYVLRGTQNPSRIRAPTEPTFVASVVVIDLNAAAGLTVTELADFAAMRTLADVDPERVVATGAPTILGVLGQADDEPLPLTLTYWDLGFLKALYSTENSYYVHYQRGDMERVMKKELQQVERSND